MSHAVAAAVKAPSHAAEEALGGVHEAIREVRDVVQAFKAVAETFSAASLNQAKELPTATGRLRATVTEASDPSEKQAAELKRATWVLVYATVALFLATAALAYATLRPR